MNKVDVEIGELTNIKEDGGLGQNEHQHTLQKKTQTKPTKPINQPTKQKSLKKQNKQTKTPPKKETKRKTHQKPPNSKTPTKIAITF